MKLAFVAVSYTPQRDGISVYIENLLCELVQEARRRDLELDLDIFVCRSARALLQRVVDAGHTDAGVSGAVRVEFIDIGGDRAFARYVRTPARIRARRPYDWILLPNLQPLWLPRARRVSVLHDLTFRVARQRFSRLRFVYLDLLTRVRLRADSDFACISDTTRQDLLRYYPRSRRKPLLYMPNGLPRKLLYQPRPRHEDVECKLIAPHIQLLFVGRVNRLKGFDRVRAACAALDRHLARYPERRATLHVVGKDTDETAQLLHGFAPSHVTVKRYGYVDDEILNRLYAKSAFCFFLSRNEGFGLPLIEAIWFGCVPILSDIAIFREIMGSDFPLFQDGSAEPDAILDFVAGIQGDALQRARALQRMARVLEHSRQGYRTAAKAFFERADEAPGPVITRPC